MTKTNINGYSFPIMARPDTLDSKLCTQILEKEEYENIDFFTEPAIIIDAGANVGFASIYFANKYKSAKVYSIEPEDGNFEVLKMNTASYPIITPIHGALWNKEEMLHLHDPGLGVLAYQTYHDANNESNNGVQGITVDTLIRQYNIEHIDLLKIDIEGSEYEVFSEDCGWLDIVSAMIVELHDRIKPGCNKLFFSAIRGRFDYEWVAGENYYFSKKSAARPVLPEQYKKENPELLPVEQMWYMRDGWESEKLERQRVALQRDEAIATQDSIQKQNIELQAQSKAAQERCDDALAHRNDALKQRDEAIMQTKDMQTQRDDALKLHEKALAKCERTQSQREKALAQRDEALAQRDEALAQRDEALAQRDEALAQRDEALIQHEKALAQRDEITQQYLTISGSTSWKITKPIRYLLDRIKRYPRSTT